MTPEKTARAILPSWRKGRLLFFTTVTDSYTTRLDYRVAAATKPNETTVFRTFKAAITNDELALCQKTAENGTALQRFFDIIGGGNLDDLTKETGQNFPPCAGEANTLIYLCSYFNFLRKYSVDQTLVKLYEARPPKERFNSESSLSIYKILSAHLQPDRAIALINADLPDIDSLTAASNVSANLLREVAIIQHDTNAFDAATKTMLLAAKRHNTEDKWRRLADFAMAANKPDQAIEYYFKAENLAPLAPPQALRLADLLVNADRFDEANTFLDRAEPLFAKQVENLRSKSENRSASE